MTVSGLRIVPLYMPLYLIQASFVAYGQTVGKRMLVYVLSLLDGLVCIATYSSLLMPFIGMLGLYIAFLLDGITTSLVVLFHSYRYGRRLPRSVNDFLAIPRGFGVPRSQRLDYSVRGLDDVARISEQVTDFCLERGVDQTRAKRVGLALEEMSANIVEHGFTKDKKPHAISVRVVHKLDELTLCLKDDCVPFDPGERLRMVGDDVTRNIGIRLVFRMARDVQYQNILGLNVLTIKM